VLADYAEDIVMFHVPPPHDGVRGFAAYRESWPPFLEWQAGGALFEGRSLEVSLAGDVGYAFALLRSGMPETFVRRGTGERLRLTLGLRRDGAGSSRMSITPSRSPRERNGARCLGGTRLLIATMKRFVFGRAALP